MWEVGPMGNSGPGFGPMDPAVGAMGCGAAGFS